MFVSRRRSILVRNRSQLHGIMLFFWLLAFISVVGASDSCYETSVELRECERGESVQIPMATPGAESEAVNQYCDHFEENSPCVERHIAEYTGPEGSCDGINTLNFYMPILRRACARRSDAVNLAKCARKLYSSENHQALKKCVTGEQIAMVCDERASDELEKVEKCLLAVVSEECGEDVASTTQEIVGDVTVGGFCAVAHPQWM